MERKPLNILAVNPGSRYFGIAIFQGPTLVDWRMKVFKGAWSREKLVKITTMISGLIDRYQPQVLALKVLPTFRSSSNLDRIASSLITLARRKKIIVEVYSLQDIKRFYGLDGKGNKRKLAEAVALQYPVLIPQWEKEVRQKNPYGLRVFESVALGGMCFHHLDTTKGERIPPRLKA